MNLTERVETWLSYEADPQIKAEINSLDPVKQQELFGSDLSFGTAGLRAAMSYGWSRMNLQTVQLASQGVAQWLVAKGGKSVVIGHDHRHHSKAFSQMAASVFAQAGLTVYRYSVTTPTPLVPFGVVHLKADFGVMITASHNPAKDNGYKVYGANGCQIMSPVDKEIASHIQAQNHVLWKTSTLSDLPCPVQEVWDAYVAKMKDLCTKMTARIPRWIPKIVYTPLHGVGAAWTERLLHHLNLPQPVPVDPQYLPDPDFPTVCFPNPEEGRGALAMAMQWAEERKARWIFANDPDVDRFNVAERQPSGEWRIFNGNEIAILYAQFLWSHRHELTEIANFAMVSSGVSSNALSRMAQVEGFRYESTLTGFKYIANAAQRLEREEGYKVLLAYEEAIGFMIDTVVWDKDGMGALVAMYALIMELNGGSLADCLDCFEQKYGCFLQHNSYYFCPTDAKSVFQRVRERIKEPLPDFLEIHSVEDQAPANLITLHLSADKSRWLTLRSSGTEPKIKFYSEDFCVDPSCKVDSHAQHVSFIQQTLEWILQPSVHNLKLASS